jgi:drug/metabolite transporter (DMT)-like permease
MQAIYMMLVSAFLWSLYPVMIALSGDKIGAPVFVMVIHISCGVSSALFAWITIKQKSIVWQNLMTVTKSLNTDQWIYLALIGLVTTLYNFCFFYAMQMTSKVAAAIIIEMWPLFAMFLAPLLISKEWKALKFNDFLIGALGLSGVIIIMLGDQNINFLSTESIHELYESIDPLSLFGIFMAIIGSLCVALSITLSSEVGNRISKVVMQEDTPSLSSAAIAEVVRRCMAIPPSLFLFWAFSSDISYTAQGLAFSVITGIFIFNIGSFTMRVALLRAPSSSINMLYYISPVLAVIWLYIIGEGNLTPTILVGGLLVIVANLAIIQKNRKPKANTA